jgi:hypothetical protein
MWPRDPLVLVVTVALIFTVSPPVPLAVMLVPLEGTMAAEALLKFTIPLPDNATGDMVELPVRLRVPATVTPPLEFIAYPAVVRVPEEILIAPRAVLPPIAAPRVRVPLDAKAPEFVEVPSIVLPVVREEPERIRVLPVVVPSPIVVPDVVLNELPVTFRVFPPNTVNDVTKVLAPIVLAVILPAPVNVMLCDPSTAPMVIVPALDPMVVSPAKVSEPLYVLFPETLSKAPVPPPVPLNVKLLAIEIPPCNWS